MEGKPSTSNRLLEDELTQDERDVEEEHFRRLYDEVLDCFLRRMENYDKKISDAISFIISSFKWGEGRKFSDIDFGRGSMILGYVFRYGPHGAGLARCKILEALENCDELQSILKMPRLNVISLGGGPGNDVIGFCSAMSRFKFTGNLVVCVEDKYVRQWKKCILVAEQLLLQGGFRGASDLFQRGKVKLCFTPFEVPEHSEYLGLERFHVVLICKLFSIMDWESRLKTVQDLYSMMNPSALILLIDSPFEDDLWRSKFEVLYLSGVNQYSSRTTVYRFGFNDNVTSKARIAVLRKRKLKRKRSNF